MPYGMGRGGWFGWPHWAYWGGWQLGFHPSYWPPFYAPSREEEQAMLEEQSRILEEQLEQIKARLNELKKVGKEKKNEK